MQRDAVFRQSTQDQTEMGLFPPIISNFNISHYESTTNVVLLNVKLLIIHKKECSMKEFQKRYSFECQPNVCGIPS